MAVAAAAVTLALASCSSSTPSPAAVKGFDEAGVSTGTGDGFTSSDWRTIKADGFRLFLTDPVVFSSECSGHGCATPVGRCQISQAAVAQLGDAKAEGIDYAIYTRNPGCLTKAITGLPASLQAHLSFAVIDIEPGPGLPVTRALIRQVTALGQTPVIYSFSSGWASVMRGSTAFSRYPLQDGQVPDFNARFPAAYPAGFPSLVPMPVSYGGWSGPADIEQQQCCTRITGPAGPVGGPADPVNLDAVSGSWLASLPHHA
jgi:hypothetical protein